MLCVQCHVHHSMHILFNNIVRMGPTTEDSDEEETDLRVEEEVGSRNDGIFNCINIFD